MKGSTQHLSPKAKIVAARAMIRERNPYFTAAVNGAVYHWVPKGSLMTMGVSEKGVVFLDEADIERLSVEQVAVSILHEIAGHWLRDHRGRMPPAGDRKLWNLAGDCEINDDLREAGWRVKDFPGGLIFPESYNLEPGLLAEAYYVALRDQRQQQQQQQQQGGGEDGEGNPGQGSGSQPGEGEGSCGSGWCGSGAGRPLPGEPSEAGQGKAGTDIGPAGAPAGRSDMETDRIRKAVAEAVRTHEKQNGRGSVPGGWSRWADDMLQAPKVNWRAKLNQLVRDATAYRPGAVLTTWKKFGRRQAALGFGPGRPVTPSWRAPVPRVAVVVDTSGSMGREELTLAVSELQGILKAVSAEVEFVAIDSAVHAAVELRNVSELAKHLTGGGGTDFRPAFELLSKRRAGKLPPEITIFITDGDGPAPARPPRGMKVIWVLVGQYARKPYLGDYSSEVGYGSFIEIQE